MTTITSLKSLRESSVQVGRESGTLSTAWSGELVVATAWLAVYVVIVAVTINSEPISRAVALVAQ